MYKVKYDFLSSDIVLFDEMKIEVFESDKNILYILWAYNYETNIKSQIGGFNNVQEAIQCRNAYINEAEEIPSDKNIHSILAEIEKIRNRLHSLADKGATFDFQGLSEKLAEANEIIGKTARVPRPENLPKDLPWRESFYDPDEDFDPFAYDGTMSLEDFKMMQERFINSLDDDLLEL